MIFDLTSFLDCVEPGLFADWQTRIYFYIRDIKFQSFPANFVWEKIIDSFRFSDFLFDIFLGLC